MPTEGDITQQKLTANDAIGITRQLQRYDEPPPDYDDEPTEYQELAENGTPRHQGSEENGTSGQNMMLPR